jgi:hypothetical protein
MKMSYFVKYHSTDGKTLIGGKTTGQSSRYQTREMAENYAWSVSEINGRERVTYTIEESPLHPEIFLHCGKYATSIGSRCNGCGKTLTVADAKAAGQSPLLNPETSWREHLG